MDTLNDKDKNEFDNEPDLSEKNDEMGILSDEDNDEFFFYRNCFVNFDENSDRDSDESSDDDNKTNETNNKNESEDFSISGIVKYSNIQTF